MSTYKKYLSIVSEENKFLDYYEAKAYLDDMVRAGKIQSYDENILKNAYIKSKKFLKKKILPIVMSTVISTSPILSKTSEMRISKPKNEAEYTLVVKNVKSDLQDLQFKITRLNRHSQEFASQSQSFKEKLKEIKQSLKALEGNKSFNISNIQNIISALEVYIKESEKLYDELDKASEQIRKENEVFEKVMQKNEMRQQKLRQNDYENDEKL